MKLCLSIFAAMVLGGAVQGQVHREVKDDKVVHLLNVVSSLSRIASSNRFGEEVTNPNQQVREEVQTEVQKVTDLEQLVALGRICRAILGSQHSTDVAYDRVFDFAFWQCVRLLVEDTSEEATWNLKILEQSSHLQGGERGFFQEAMARHELNKKRARSRTK